jgi:hypothetical protein
LETDPKVFIDEAHHCNVFRSDEDEGSIQENSMKVLMQQKSEMKEGKSDVGAFENKPPYR